MKPDAAPAVTPEEVVARAFRAFFARDAEQLIAAALDKFPPVVGTMSIDTFGHVHETPEIAHVVYRLTIQTPSGPVAFFPEPQLATVKLEGAN